MQLYQPSITGSLSVSGSVITNGTITATTLVVQTVTSSVSYLTGSTQFGSLSSNTHTFTGSVLVSGSITSISTIKAAGYTATSSLYSLDMGIVGSGTYLQSYVTSGGGAADLYFWTGNSEKMRISSTGIVGIAATPSAWDVNTFKGIQLTGGSGGSNTFLMGRTDAVVDQFQLGVNAYFDGSAWKYINTGYSSRYYQYSGGHFFDRAVSGTAGGSVTFVESMRIKGNGSVIVNGTTAVNETTNRGNLSVAGAATAIFNLIYNNTTEAGYLYHNGTSAELYLVNSVAGGKLYCINISGGVYLSQGATSWTAVSDIRLKNINSNIENAVEKLSTLRTVNFSWKSDSENKENLGLIAQDVEAVFPQVIDRGKRPSNANEEQTDETEYLGVRYQELVPVLVKAIQEQQQQINELKALLNK